MKEVVVVNHVMFELNLFEIFGPRNEILFYPPLSVLQSNRYRQHALVTCLAKNQRYLGDFYSFNPVTLNRLMNWK